MHQKRNPSLKVTRKEGYALRQRAFPAFAGGAGYQCAYLEEDAAEPQVDLEQRTCRKWAETGEVDPVQGSHVAGRREHVLNGVETDGRDAKDCDRDAGRSESSKAVVNSVKKKRHQN